PVGLQYVLALAGGDGLGGLRREEALQTCEPPILEPLDAKQRLHAREELGLVDWLREEIVGASLDALHALVVRVERSREHHWQECRRRVLSDLAAHLVARDARHHDVEQDEVGRVLGDALERLLAVLGGAYL